MLALLFLLLMLLVFFSVARAIAGAGRRRRMLEDQRRRELEQRARDGDTDASPFADLPFGGLLEAMMGAGSAWTRTMEYDERTGRWVDLSTQATPEVAAHAPSARAEEPREQPRFSRASPR